MGFHLHVHLGIGATKHKTTVPNSKEAKPGGENHNTGKEDRRPHSRGRFRSHLLLLLAKQNTSTIDLGIPSNGETQTPLQTPGEVMSRISQQREEKGFEKGRDS